MKGINRTRTEDSATTTNVIESVSNSREMLLGGHKIPSISPRKSPHLPIGPKWPKALFFWQPVIPLSVEA